MVTRSLCLHTWHHMLHRLSVCTLLPYIRKICQSFNLAILPQTMRYSILAKFKFGSTVWYCNTYIRVQEILVNFNLAISTTIAKSPNLNRRHIFRIYGNFKLYCLMYTQLKVDLRYVCLKYCNVLLLVLPGQCPRWCGAYVRLYGIYSPYK